MSRRSNVLGGVGVEVSPSSSSTINNIVTIRNTPSYPNMPTEEVESQKPDNPYLDRSLETAEQRKESIEVLTSEKHLIDALSIMVDVIYENPFIINKLVVTDHNTLAALIKLLTMSDEVVILTEDPECGCLNGHLLKVTSIHVVKGSVTTEFKYSHQNAKRILDEHHISIKYVRC